MAKYYGDVGFRTSSETESGIWEESIVERPYYGDILKNYVRNSYRDNMTTIKTPECNNSISIVADAYANENFHNIVYATFMGTKWTISNIDVQYPRLILALGGVYNGDSVDTTE